MFIFNSRFNTLRVVLRPSKRLIVGTQVVKEDGLAAVFERGLFITEDEETAQLLRDKIKKTEGPKIAEPDLAMKCPICDKVFKNQKGLNIHLVSHRPDVQIAEPEAPAPKVAEA